MNEISLNFQNERIKVDGKITAQNLKPWPVTLFEHGCMGWYGYVPTMECFHGILSMDHDLSGALTINDNKIDFDRGHGYIEKDWGKNFPKDWVWAQSNNFEDSKISVSVSLATIPWRKYEFSGFIIGIQHGDQLYRFTTYNFSKIAKIELKNNTLEWNLKRGNLDLELKIRPGKRSGLLYAPDKIDMIAKVEEFLDGHISLTLNQGDVTIIIYLAIIPLAFLAKNDTIRGLPFLISLNAGVTTWDFNEPLSIDLKYSTDAQLIINFELCVDSSSCKYLVSVFPQKS